MLTRLTITTLLILAAVVAYAAAKEKETIQLQVVSLRTKFHGRPPDEVFEYTDVMFTLVGGKKVAYACDQRGKVCPVVEPGKTYTADQEGTAIYVSMSSPTGKPLLVKFKGLGEW